mgnify:CR=1 FL=1
MKFRVGQGFDVHALVAGRRLVLGGVEIPFSQGLLGHSDADVLLHAITDALLGAAALGDIGRHFPDTDARFKGADSWALLQHTAGLVAGAGYRIGNIDSTVIAQAPKLAPHIEGMRARIAAALAIEPFFRFIKRFSRHFGKVEKTVGVLLVLTGVGFLTGSMQTMSFWLLETFPALQKLG